MSCGSLRLANTSIKDSCPAGDQAGSVPPFCETLDLVAVAGDRADVTSSRPDWSDTNATHLPSGETAGLLVEFGHDNRLGRPATSVPDERDVRARRFSQIVHNRNGTGPVRKPHAGKAKLLRCEKCVGRFASTPPLSQELLGSRFRGQERDGSPIGRPHRIMSVAGERGASDRAIVAGEYPDIASRLRREVYGDALSVRRESWAVEVASLVDRRPSHAVARYENERWRLLVDVGDRSVPRDRGIPRCPRRWSRHWSRQ